MKITRSQLRQIIQEAVVTPRTRGQNDRKGFSSGIYEEDEIDEDSDDSSLTLKEIRSIILEEISLNTLFSDEFEGKPLKWKYKVVDSESNRSLASSFSAVGDIKNLEIEVSDGPNNIGFRFKLGDIRGGWENHELTQQIIKNIKGEEARVFNMPGDKVEAGEPWELVDIEIRNNGRDIEISPEDFVNSYIFPSEDHDALKDGSTELSAIVYFDFVFKDEIDFNEPEVSVVGNRVKLSITDSQGSLPESFYHDIFVALAPSISSDENVSVTGLAVGDENKIEFDVDNGSEAIIGAHVTDFRNFTTPSGRPRYGFELVIYKKRESALVSNDSRPSIDDDVIDVEF